MKPTVVDRPSSETTTIFAEIVAQARLGFRNFQKDRDLLWLSLNDAVAGGKLSADEVEILKRDHHGDFTLPLAKLYAARGQTALVTKWMRQTASFWNFNWVDTSVKGARGSGTIALFRLLASNGGEVGAATLAVDHLRMRLVGANYHPGLRQRLRAWRATPAEIRDSATRIGRMVFSHPEYTIPELFDQLEHAIAVLKPIINAGANTEVLEKLRRIESEIAAERARWPD